MKPVPRLKPDATTWVMRTSEGDMARVRVKDMTDQHIQRWILYFRRRLRERGYSGSDSDLDELIRKTIVTAPMIYAEAQKRGVMVLVTGPVASQPPVQVNTDQVVARFLADVAAVRPTFYRDVMTYAKQVRFVSEISQIHIHFAADQESLYYLCLSNVHWMVGEARRVCRRPVNIQVLLATTVMNPTLDLTGGSDEDDIEIGARLITFEEE